ncbi:HNH endonuclease [Brevundimonas sp. AJA228-03]|uniref:HNH endonuclease n=1 Tax=Brevundimonas sp. AJA228-03 TaxID=2752515 RepID=UPI001ADFBD68|nr:HNH endonuclease [Brevundimonas sp. AJA228-03]QTN19557.1 HNH endonuclease [Brevundimonas sp. AJA228-03]
MENDSTSEDIDLSLNHIALLILQLLKAHSTGLDIDEIKSLLPNGADQMHLDRRLRSLRKYYHLPGKQEGSRYVYTLGARKTAVTDSGAISGKLRAEALNLAKGRCQMCGKTVSEDGVKLQIDHKIPQDWGGLTLIENLWAICEQCNNGKRNHFKSFDAEKMASILKFDTVHQRIAHLLKMHMGEPVDSNIIEFVANATERQEDWHKRLRDLRYPVIGLQITSGRYKTEQGFTRSTYTLHNWRDLPPDHQKLIRDWEKPAKRAALKRLLGIV